MVENKLSELGFKYLETLEGYPIQGIASNNGYWKIDNRLGGVLTLRRVSNTLWEATLQHNIWSYLHLTEDNLLEIFKILNIQIGS